MEKEMKRLWYWTQLAIWPLIRDTTCYYCIFLRGMLAGALVGLTFAGGVIWLLQLHR